MNGGNSDQWKQPWADNKMRIQLDRFLKVMKERSESQFQSYLQIWDINYLLDLLAEERGKFSQCDDTLMRAMIQALIEKGEYPTSWGNNPIDVFKMVSGWGARWHQWMGVIECPFCKADLRNMETGPPFRRQIAISDRSLDRTMAYKCPDCGKEWSRAADER